MVYLFIYCISIPHNSRSSLGGSQKLKPFKYNSLQQNVHMPDHTVDLWTACVDCKVQALHTLEFYAPRGNANTDIDTWASSKPLSQDSHMQRIKGKGSLFLLLCIDAPYDRLPSEKEDRAPVSLTVVVKREFQQVSFVYMENLVKFPSSSQQLKLQELY